MQAELKTMREFRRKRVELQEQIENLDETLVATKFEHRQQLTALEEKFFEEKVRRTVMESVINILMYSCVFRKRLTVESKS